MRVGLKTGGRYRIKNFSAGGYGPHQMLAAIESGKLDETVDCRPRHVLYQAIKGHARRVLGHANWDRHGPKYEIAAQGVPVRRGNFDDLPDGLFNRRWFDLILDNSFLYREMVKNRISENGIDLMAAIVDKSRRLIESKFPGTEFLVLMRSTINDTNSRNIVAQFRERGLTVHLEKDIFPDDGQSHPEYRVGEHDGHPNALANEIVADYIVENIVKD